MSCPAVLFCPIVSYFVWFRPIVNTFIRLCLILSDFVHFHPTVCPLLFLSFFQYLNYILFQQSYFECIIFDQIMKLTGGRHNRTKYQMLFESIVTAQICRILCASSFLPCHRLNASCSQRILNPTYGFSPAPIWPHMAHMAFLHLLIISPWAQTSPVSTTASVLMFKTELWERHKLHKTF